MPQAGEVRIGKLDFVVFILFASIGLLIPAAVAARHFFGIDPISVLHINWGRTFVGIVFTLLASAVCLLNFYLALIVPWLHKRRHGSMTDYAYMSGLPVIGGFFILCAGVLMPPSFFLGIFLLLLYLLDANGLLWFSVFSAKPIMSSTQTRCHSREVTKRQ